MRNLLSLIVLLIIPAAKAKAQDYTNYYTLINKAEEQFVLKKDSSCFRYYDLAFSQQTPFLKDPYSAGQIAYFLGDSARFYGYLKICFNNSMPLTAIDAAPLLRKSMNAGTRTKIRKLYEKEFRAKVVDPALKEKICLACYQSDSIKVYMGRDEEQIRRFYASENAARQFLLDSLLKKGLYANEHLLNIRTDQAYKDFHRDYNRPDVYGNFPASSNKLEYELRVNCPFNILIHSHCFFRENKDLLFEAVKKGYLHPKEFGILQETALLWYKADNNKAEQCPPPETVICYNIFGPDPTRPTAIFSNTKTGLEIVEQNRKQIFLQTYVIDQQKKALETAYGFAFFFDFVDRQ